MERQQYERVYRQCCHQLELQLRPTTIGYNINLMSGRPIAQLTPPTLNLIDGFSATLLILDSEFQEDIDCLEKDLLTHLGVSINQSYQF